ncbi:serine/threonine-protein kinase VRK1 isoform X10 [Mus musculus]|uniref:serine/threonine-protein kinase VRK1 isoform X10 n=1 Tax=Mus musculus TaxID=10090 RepID=UPI0011AE8633|nr:serine/threonine-protein kinase VRK1 isoform X10 [Mus musculus]
MPRVKAAQAGRPGPAKRRLAEQFAAGEVLTDMSRKEWKLGLPIGQGGFGCIYLADTNSSKPVGSDAPCVVKVVYLVDYGLAYRYCPDGVHKEYKEDPKRCHDGTLEFTSIDAHKGVAPSRRGDLEILGYCMIQWLSGCLPWEDNLKDPNYVRDSKIRYRDNVAALMEKCFPEKNKPGEIAKYMESVKLLEYTEKPLYQNLRDILLQGLKAIGSKDDGKLDFSAVENGSVKTRPASKKRKKEAEESAVCAVEDMECSDTQVQEAAQTRSRRQQHLGLEQDMLRLDRRGSRTRKKAQK